MATFDLCVRGGRVVGASGTAPLDVWIRGGRIAEVSRGSGHDAAEEIDAAGLLVLPGMVDTHVHLMEPGDPSRENFVAGSSAAAANGVTTIVEHTHSWPVTTVDRLTEKLAVLAGRSHVDYGLSAHLWPDNAGQLAGLWQAGVVFFKIFTCSTHGIEAAGSDRLLTVLAELARLRASSLIHCEDELITAQNERLLRQQGRDDGGVIPAWRSREAEVVAVAVASTLARLTTARVTIAHVSHPGALEVLESERQRGAAIAAESCPQYFYLREQEVDELGALRKFTPPARARTAADEDAIWAAFNSGRISHLSTDHAPATREQKAAGIWDAHFGLPGLDTTLPLMIDAALSGRTTLERVAEAYAEAPARWYGIPGKGRIAPGLDADLVLVDPLGTRTLTDAGVLSLAGWTPYAGRRVRGAIRRVLLRGVTIAVEGKPTAERTGRWVPGPGRKRTQECR
jgi:dihydroorotase (multifunctional complex type)